MQSTVIRSADPSGREWFRPLSDRLDLPSDRLGDRLNLPSDRS